MADSLMVTPHSLEAERAVLGASLINEKELHSCIELLSVHDFYEPAHQKIFSAIRELVQNNTPVDYVSLTNKLTKNGDLAKIGNGTLVDLGEYTMISNTRQHIKIIKENSKRRSIVIAAREVINLAMKSDGAIEDICDNVDELMFNVISKGQTSQLFSLQEAQANVLTNIAERKNTTGLMGISSGYTDIDKLTDGFCRGQLIILAARAGMGKTSFALNLASGYINSREAGQGHVLVFSLEMTASELAMRLLSADSMIPAKKIKRADLEPEDMERFYASMKKFSSQKMTIDDTGGLSIAQLKTRARAVMRNNPYQLMVVDHLQIMDAGDNKNFINRTYEIQKITSALKALAKELQIPIIALSQINRGVEGRADKRPMLSDLRDSGSIEQDADIVMMIYRDNYYNNNNLFPNVAELIFAKHRDGETGMIPLYFRPEILCFEAMQEYEIEAYRAHVSSNRHKEHDTQRPTYKPNFKSGGMPYKDDTHGDPNYRNPNF